MPQLLERLTKFRTRVKGQKSARQRFQGKTLNRVKTRADKITTRVKDRKPNFIPQVDEALTNWKPGSRVAEMLPTADSRNNDISLGQLPTKKKKLAKQSNTDISF